MIKALVTGAGALLGQGIIRSLQTSSLDVHIVAADPSPEAAGLYWADTAVRIPMASDPGYLPRIEELLAEERPDVVLVGTDVELGLFAAHRERLEATYDTHVVVSSPRVVEIADDKWLTAEFLREHGLPHPASALPGGESALVEAVGFPLVVKPRHGARSVGVSVVHTREALAQAIAAGTDVVIQEAVGTDETEFTAAALCFDGACCATIVMRRRLRDGNTYVAWVEPYPELNYYVRRVAEVLRPHGPANFQFRLDRDGVPKVFEINGRFSGTTPLRALAGFNEVEMTVRHLLDGTPVVQPEVEPMTILRHWSETVVRPTPVGGDGAGVLP